MLITPNGGKGNPLKEETFTENKCTPQKYSKERDAKYFKETPQRRKSPMSVFTQCTCSFDFKKNIYNTAIGDTRVCKTNAKMMMQENFYLFLTLFQQKK
jgi:hypothetical protein